MEKNLFLENGKEEVIEKEEVLQNDSEIIENLNEFFKNAASTLSITENSFIANKD